MWLLLLEIVSREAGGLGFRLFGMAKAIQVDTMACTKQRVPTIVHTHRRKTKGQKTQKMTINNIYLYI